jgi:hypothetical protein
MCTKHPFVMKVMTEVQRNVLPFWLVFDEISKKGQNILLGHANCKHWNWGKLV